MPSFAVPGFTRNDNLVDLLAVQITYRTLDERAFFVDEGRRTRCERRFPNSFPHSQQVLEVPLDLCLGAGSPGCTQDDPHPLWNIELFCDSLEAASVLRIRYLARNSAAARRVRHQNGIPSRERKICRERRSLVAALFLHDLHEEHLAPLDDLLDLVLPPQPLRATRHFLHRVAADLLDRISFVIHSVLAAGVELFFRSAVERRDLLIFLVVGMFLVNGLRCGSNAPAASGVLNSV